MAVLRSALFVDFDNMFNGIHGRDPEAAFAFGESPRRWLERLATPGEDGQQRRFLSVRVYLNPAGRIGEALGPTGDGRLDFGRYREPLAAAGCGVIDCRPLSAALRNSTDVRLIVDVLADLERATPVDEYLIATGDTDLAPLLHVLRAADRRTGVISTSGDATAYQHLTDLVIGVAPLLEMIGRGPRAAQVAATSIITKEMAAAAKAVRLSSLGQTIRESIGDTASTTGWFGYGTMRDFIDSLHDAQLATNPGFVWDPTRHAPPLDPTAGMTEADLPAPIAAIRVGAELPLLASATWPLLFEQIAVYVRRAPRPLTLTECTITVRNELEGTDPLASRSVVNSVLHRIQDAGLPLERDPPPDAGELQATYKASIVSEYVAAGREMIDGLHRALDRWLSGETGIGS